MTDIVARRGENAVMLALASGANITEAARAGKVSPRTVNRWMNDDPTFTIRVAEMRAELLSRMVGGLVDASLLAVATLREMMLNADSEAVRVRAATAILNAVVVVRESVDLEERLAALEAADQNRESYG